MLGEADRFIQCRLITSAGVCLAWNDEGDGAESNRLEQVYGEGERIGDANRIRDERRERLIFGRPASPARNRSWERSSAKGTDCDMDARVVDANECKELNDGEVLSFPRGRRTAGIASGDGLIIICWLSKHPLGSPQSPEIGMKVQRLLGLTGARHNVAETPPVLLDPVVDVDELHGVERLGGGVARIRPIGSMSCGSEAGWTFPGARWGSLILGSRARHLPQTKKGKSNCKSPQICSWFVGEMELAAYRW